MTFEQSVHDTIMAILASTPVPKVGFDPSTGSTFVAMTVDETDTVLPVEAEAGPVSFRMKASESRHLLGGYKAEVDVVVWQVFVAYADRVAVESLVETFSRTIPASGAQRQYELRLLEASVEHPPRNAPEKGTFLSMQVEAAPAPA